MSALWKNLLGILACLLVSACAATGPADPALTRIAFGSCLDQKIPAPILQTVRAYRPDVFLFLGDNVYGDVTSGEMTELKHAYARLGRNPEFQALRDRTRILATWDDHDYGANDAGAGFPWRQKAEKIFLDFWEVPPDDPRRRRVGIYSARVIGPPGRRVQIILLDTRSFRSELLRGGPNNRRYVPDPDPSKTLLGAAQWAWLEKQLRVPAELRLIASSIQVLPTGHRFEKWQNLPAERRRLIDLLRLTEANGVVLLSGDRHLGAVYVDREALSYPLYEITSSSLNRPWRGAAETDPLKISRVIGEENFGTVDIDWSARRLTVALRNLSGETERNISVPLDALQVR